MRVLVCVKRVPATGSRLVLLPDGSDLDTRSLGFTVSPHEECAVEEAVRIVETHGGSSTVLTLGPEAASEQLRDALAVGIDRAVLLPTDGSAWDAIATSAAIAEAVRADEAEGGPYDLLLFGDEAADSGDHQVGIRVAVALDRPFVGAVKALEVADGLVRCARSVAGARETVEAPLPAVVSVREGLNLPRYPSLPGRLRAKKKELTVRSPEAPAAAAAWTTMRLRLPVEEEQTVEVLGTGPEAAAAVVDLLGRMGLVRR